MARFWTLPEADLEKHILLIAHKSGACEKKKKKNGKKKKIMLNKHRQFGVISVRVGFKCFPLAYIA